MKRDIVLIGLIFLAAGCSSRPIISPSSANFSPAYNYTHRLQIGSQVLMVEIADTPRTEAQGLSDRASMENSQGMLFDFGSDAAVDPAFWMPDMKFNLDMIWIYKNKVIGITANVPAPSCQLSAVGCQKNLPLYYPPSPVNWVVEVNAGWTAENKIKTGDEVRLIN